MVTITQEQLDKGLSCNGSWSWKQLKILGLPDSYFRPNGNLIGGWKYYLIGKKVSDEVFERFVKARKTRAMYKEQLCFGI